MASGLVFSLGYLYAAPLFYGGPAIPMALNTAIAFCVLGLGLIGAAGPRALPARPFVGTSVRAQLLRAFLPFTVAIVLVSDWLTQAVAWFASPSSMALASAASVVIATVIAAAMCWFFAGQIGGRLDRAEAELRSANDLLETPRPRSHARPSQMRKRSWRNETSSCSSDRRPAPDGRIGPDRSSGAASRPRGAQAGGNPARPVGATLVAGPGRRRRRS